MNSVGALSCFFSAPYDYAPQVTLLGSSVPGGVNLTFGPEIAAPATAEPSFAFPQISCGAAFAVQKNAGPRGVVMNASGRGATFQDTVAFRGEVLGDIMGAAYDQTKLSRVGNATVRRDRHILTSVALGSALPAPDLVPINPPFPDAKYVPTFPPTTAASSDIVAKAGNTLTVQATVPATVDIVLNWYN